MPGYYPPACLRRSRLEPRRQPALHSSPAWPQVLRAAAGALLRGSPDVSWVPSHPPRPSPDLQRRARTRINIFARIPRYICLPGYLDTSKFVKSRIVVFAWIPGYTFPDRCPDTIHQLGLGYMPGQCSALTATCKRQRRADVGPHGSGGQGRCTAARAGSQLSLSRNSSRKIAAALEGRLIGS